MSKFQISRDSQALYLTVVTKDRLPVFRTDNMSMVVCKALDEARNSGGLLIFAYVIMPDHLHLITDQPKTSADVVRYVKGITGRRVIDYLKQNDFKSSLAKLRSMNNGSEGTRTHFGSRRRMSFLSSAKLRSCKR